MPGPLVAGIAGSIGSAVIGSSSAKKAAKAQSAAADAQIAETRRQFDLIQGLLKPYVTAGTGALQAQLDLMGLGGSMGTAPTIEEFQVRNASTGQPGGLRGSEDHPRSGVQPVVGPGGATRFRVGTQEFSTRAEAEAYAETQRTGGVSAQDAQRNAIAAIENGAQFGQLVKQGEYALMANGAATGGLRGGDTQAAMAQFRPQMLQALIDKQLANYGGIAANGQNAAAMTGTAAQNAGAQINAALGDKGAAGAGAALATGQAWQNAGAGILNTLGSMATGTTGTGPWQKWTF